MSKIPEISAFFPAFNEEGNISQTVTYALLVLDKVADKYEVIVVNDGSKDRTGEIAQRLSKQNPHVRVINHKENLGYGNALRSGFYNARYDPVVMTDSDGQFDFAEVEKLLAVSSQADVVIGYRIKRMDPPIRFFIAWVWKILIWIFLGFKVRDVDCGFKLVKQHVLQKIPKLESTVGGMINPELLIKTHKNGFTFIQVGVHHFPRRTGKANGVGPRKIIISFIELVRLAYYIRFSHYHIAGSKT